MFISRAARRPRLTETLIILGITKTESTNCFIINCFEENNDKQIDIVIGNHALRSQSYADFQN